MIQSIDATIDIFLFLSVVSNQHNNMGAGKNKSHRKKRISKHVIQAEERKNQTEVEKQLLLAAENGTSTTSSTPSLSTPTEEKTSNTKTKDPEEAASYLTLWKYDQTNNTKSWKFNKNTQSWLQRHMYDGDKVSKTTFATLIDYLIQGGDRLISRVEEDAKMRARRYKDWEKKKENSISDETTAETKEESKSTSAADDITWNSLDDHDKRKEYKRARKVLDSIKAARDEKKDDTEA